MSATETDLAKLVEYVRAYGDDGGYRTELHQLYPYLEGWYNAAQYLQRRHIDAYWEARGGFDPWSSTDPGTDPGYDALTAEYDKVLDEIARGERQPES